MANPLTGDFEAVLQVSGATINRLLASMHQNAFENPKLPSFPHTVRMRIGDDLAYEGVRGLAHAQISVPRIELIHGVTDRFILEVAVRAWYRPDPGTEPMAAFIHGTVRAEYRVQDIDPSCIGWSKNAADFLWVRVVRSSVVFRGTAKEDKDVWELELTDPGPDPAAVEAANIAKVTRQIARLLARRFEATPHKLESQSFRRGSMRSLNAPIGGAAVTLPIGLSGAPWGDIHSIDNVLLGGHDLAIAVNIDYIMGVINQVLEPLKAFNRTIPVNKPISTVYRVGVHPPSVQWLPQGSHAVFKIKISGWANTNSILPNATVSIEQDVVLNFSGNFWLSPGSLHVTAQATGVFGSPVAHLVKNFVLAAVPPIVQTACTNAQSSLDALTAQTGGLSNVLASLDDQAAVWLDVAEFVADGLVVRGAIDVAPRRAPVVKQEKTVAEDAHSALESWIPGGRIDRIEWSWSWSGSGEPGAATYRDRFLLRRPWGKTSRWGTAVGLTMPLPGLDGWGSVCLRIIGARVHPVTGDFETVTSERRCTKFGYDIADMFTDGGRLFLRDMPELSRDVPFPQLRERPLVAARRGAAGTANNLIVYVDGAWDGETADTLGRALEECGRYDAGLSVMVLLREGILDGHGPQLIISIEDHLRKLGIAGHVNEDVNGSWSRTLGLRAGSGEPGWAIITPEGTAPWKHQGRIRSQELSSALDMHLRRCRDLRPVAYRPGIAVGASISAVALHPGFSDLADLVEAPCPPVPLGRLAQDSVVTFVQKHSAVSASHLRRLAGQYNQIDDERAATVVVVVDDANAREAESLKNELGVDFVMVADPSGKITDRFRVGVWPTTIRINRSGVVSDVEIGLAVRRHEDSYRRNEEHANKADAAL